MSGITEATISEFKRSIRKIGGTQGLADCAMTNRAHFSQMLHGKRRGLHTWKKVLSFLTQAQVLHLQQSATWNAELETIWQRELQKRERNKS